MSDLLAIGSSAIGTLRAALATVGENVANAETAGYVRRTVRVTELPPSGTAGGMRLSGVRLAAVERQWEHRLAAETRALGGDAAVSRTKADTAGAIEAALADDDNGIGKGMTALFVTADRWAADPASRAWRQDWLGQLDATVAAFNRTGAGLERLRSSADERLASAVIDANSVLAELATINRSIRAASPATAAAAELADRRDQALDRLSGLLDVRVAFSERGEATVSNGAMLLVDGSDPATLSLDVPATGPVRLVATANSGTATFQPASGSIAGMIAGRQAVELRIADLDALAQDFAAGLNLWSQSGLAPDGSPGALLLGGDSATELELLPVSADRLAAASGGATNGNLLGLRDLRQSAGYERRWDDLMASSASAKAISDRAATASTALHDAAKAAQALRSGVDLDREAADLLRLQQAYGAAARILDAAKTAIDTLLAIR